VARPYIEFVQCQNIDWEELDDGTQVKRLNVDPVDGEETLLLRYPAGFERVGGGAEPQADEYFVLDGEVRIGARSCGYHAYGFVPRGAAREARSSKGGATLLVFRHGRTDPNSVDGVAESIALDAPAMPWDVSTYDPKLTHLRLARKILRLGPNDSCRTFLLAGMPHGVPPVDRLPAETHDHCEEMFMLAGEMWAPEGRMRQGAYFFRPPGIVHGPHVSESGFFQIMRSPGVNAIKTKWADTPSPLPIGAPYAPVMPEGTPESWRREWTGEAPY